MWLIIPVKDFDNAKQRLDGCLGRRERAGLYRAMLEDVLACVKQVPRLAGVFLVTRDPEAMRLATAFGAQVIEEPENRSHSDAVQWGIDRLLKEGVDTLFTLPGDVPLITPAEVNALIDSHVQGSAFTIAPSRDRRGSNAVLCSPPDVVPLRFGADSFYRHLDLARRSGVEPAVVSLPGVALDIDTPADLELFLARDSTTRARAFLDASGVAARMAAGRPL